MYALVVDEVDEDALRWSSQRLQKFRDALPVCSLDLPVSDVDRTAVLSWRWDIDSEEGFSANIWLALRLAKQLRIRHLFMDLVSVDQNLGGDALLNEVVAFSDLYQRLPVIVTYDHPSAGTRRKWYWTMRRP